MTDPRSPQAAARQSLTSDDVQREERHQRLATLLGAFSDGELPAETASQIDAHLLGCQRCRREVQMHRSVRERLAREPLTAAPSSLRDRIIASVAAAPPPQWEAVAATTAEVRADARPLKARHARLPWIAAAVIGLVLLAVAGMLITARGPMTADTVVSVSSVPLVSAAVADYRRVMHGDLPGRGRDLSAVRDAVPFPIQPLDAAGLRLLAAWTTTLNGEPAAVLAYRIDEHVVLQYIVSELELYRPAELRDVFSDGRLLAARDGRENIVAWPEASSGSLIVGDVPVTRLEKLRTPPR
jgi:anti-sigma factor RsiW